jgi:hypothetical protein
MAEALKRTAVLVVRAWFEERPGEPVLRARITWTPDVTAPELSEISAAASEAEIVNAIRAWLKALTAVR